MNAMTTFADFNDPDLGTVMIVAPDVGLDQLTQALDGIGFVAQGTRDGIHSVAFSYRGQRPHIVYSHNPVVDLRVLEVGTLPPVLRRAVQGAVATLSRVELAADLHATDARQALRAIWAAVEMERMDLIEPLEALAQTASGVVSEEALRAHARLSDLNQKRVDVIGGVRLVAVAAVEFARELTRRHVAQSLLIRPEDTGELFTADVAPLIADALAAKPLELGKGVLGTPQDDSAVTAAPAGLLRFDNMLSRPFPQGYRSGAGWLLPDRIWLTWTTHDPQHGRIRYDGLVFTGERWLFCPRPYRLIEAALGQVR